MYGKCGWGKDCARIAKMMEFGHCRLVLPADDALATVWLHEGAWDKRLGR